MGPWLMSVGADCFVFFSSFCGLESVEVIVSLLIYLLFIMLVSAHQTSLFYGIGAYQDVSYLFFSITIFRIQQTWISSMSQTSFMLRTT